MKTDINDIEEPEVCEFCTAELKDDNRHFIEDLGEGELEICAACFNEMKASGDIKPLNEAIAAVPDKTEREALKACYAGW